MGRHVTPLSHATNTQGDNMIDLFGIKRRREHRERIKQAEEKHKQEEREHTKAVMEYLKQTSQQIESRVGNPYRAFLDRCKEMGVTGFCIHRHGNLSFVAKRPDRDKLNFDAVADLLNYILWRHLEPDPQDEDDEMD